MSVRVLLVVSASLLVVGCGKAPHEIETGGNCISYGDPCTCPDGRASCRPHSSGICQCGAAQTTPTLEIAPSSLEEVDPSASEDGETVPRWDPARFASCRADDECVALRSACFSAAINRDHEATYREILRETRFRCEPPGDEGWPALTAQCAEGVCEVVAP